MELPEGLNMEDRDLLLLLAAHLYEHGHLSMGHAAAMAGLDKRSFIDRSGKFGVSVFNYSADDLKQEFRDAWNDHCGQQLSDRNDEHRRA